MVLEKDSLRERKKERNWERERERVNCVRLFLIRIAKEKEKERDWRNWVSITWLITEQTHSNSDSLCQRRPASSFFFSLSLSWVFLRGWGRKDDEERKEDDDYERKKRKETINLHPPWILILLLSTDLFTSFFPFLVHHHRNPCLSHFSSFGSSPLSLLPISLSDFCPRCRSKRFVVLPFIHSHPDQWCLLLFPRSLSEGLTVGKQRALSPSPSLSLSENEGKESSLFCRSFSTTLSSSWFFLVALHP